MALPTSTAFRMPGSRKAFHSSLLSCRWPRMASQRGLSGMKKMSTRNSRSGMASQPNIPRQYSWLNIRVPSSIPVASVAAPRRIR